jgi:hypothetical protein|tara:strand:+ start:23398 stop:23568 length:171 start_codon:yes stop_codon:yes gene_type:complete
MQNRRVFSIYFRPSFDAIIEGGESLSDTKAAGTLAGHFSRSFSASPAIKQLILTGI